MLHHNSIGNIDSNVYTRLLQMVYQSVVASVTFFAAVCWGGGIRSCGENKLNKLVRKASSVVGMEVDSVEDERKARSYHGQSLLSSLC